MPKDISSENDSTANATYANSAATARAEIFNALHQEMELADYCTAKSGHKVRHVPRSQAPMRALKRQALEKVDKVAMAIEVDDDDYKVEDNGGEAKKRTRLRGPKVAFRDAVMKSMPLANNVMRAESAHESINEKANENRKDIDFDTVDQNERHDMLQEVASLGINLDHYGVDKMHDFEGDEEDGPEDDEIENDDTKNSDSECDEIKDDQDEKETKTRSRIKVTVCKTGLIKPMNTTKRVMHRLKEFSSQRMAQQHGEAIGAHIRGMSERAVQKLREVAKKAPGAPQVYSSLGMVFESMLTEVERRSGEQGDNETEDNSRLNHLQRRLELAQKAYASYHVAALLCKRDFVLWERSGDAAVKGAQIYSEIIDHMENNPMATDGVSERAVSTESNTTRTSFDPNAGPEKWSSEKKQLLEDAHLAYQSSDNLRPPGVDVPCKLAQVQMRLGNYMDALSILTDMGNMAGGNSLGSENGSNNKELARPEREASHPCWLLYADLMIRIGHECKQWNEKASNAQHYMFKRWLRTNSKKFDWQERRLQALCLALEAAAGSASCANLIKWMREHAEKCCDKKTKETADDENDAGGNAADNDSGEAKENSTDEDEYEKEREKLLNMNKVELRKFDRMTKEMSLVAGSHISKNRITSRAALIKKHRAAIKDLAMHKCIKEQENTPANLEDTANNVQPDPSKVEPSPKPLPLQGSRAIVYDIAALLLRQCIQLRMFKGGLLTIQSVLEYSKERVLRHERSIQLQKENELLRNSDQGFFQSCFKYDQIDFESDDCEEVFISDDADLEQPGVLQLLKSGKLPTDITAMHAICLFGAGGQDYIALSYANQVCRSNELDLFDKEDVSPDASITDEKNVSLAVLELHAPINNTFVLSSIVDLATENAKWHPQSLHSLLSILRKYFLTKIDNNGGLDFDEVLSSSNELERIHALKILIATLKLLIHCARMDLATSDDPGEEEVNTVEEAVNDSIYALNIVRRFQYKLWNPCVSDWSLPQSSKDMVSILSGAISILVQASLVEDERVLDSVQVGFMKSRTLISTICEADNIVSQPSAFSNTRKWRSFPLPSSWQTSFHEKLSSRAHNLCVACCVSSFSGWEPCEFSLDQLNKSDINFFGVTMEGPCVAGFLPNNASSAIAEQWDYISQILPDLELLPFEAHLEHRKKTSFYQKVMKNIEKRRIDSSGISMYGEEDGIRALLSFSTLSLIVAERSEGEEKDEFLKLSMSVLLPMTQFSIDKLVWQSKIGSEVLGDNGSKIEYYLDENCHWLGPTKTKQQERIQYTNNKMQQFPRPFKVARPTRKLPQPTKVVRVPTSVLLEEWTKGDVHVEKRFALEEAQSSMKKLDIAMKNLRKSRTLNCLQRASIDVAVSLITLVAFDECNNPFLCMQQASMFAAMGSKRGNNDEPFKRFLPLKDKCSSLEALNVLCRADCLRAVNFLHEAQYLCTWVASVCQAHRNRLDEELPWDSRWRVIAVLTYTVSTFLDETGEALFLLDDPAGSLRKWEEVAKDEFSHGKSDALFLVEENSIPGTDISALPSNKENMSIESDFPGTSQATDINALPDNGRQLSAESEVPGTSQATNISGLPPSGENLLAESEGMSQVAHINALPANGEKMLTESEVPGTSQAMNISALPSSGKQLLAESESPGTSQATDMNALPTNGENNWTENEVPWTEVPLLNDQNHANGINHFEQHYEGPGADVPLPSNQNHTNVMNHSGYHNEGPGTEVPLLGDQSHMNGMNHYGYHNELELNGYLCEGLNEGEAVEDGVEVVGEVVAI